MFEKFADRLRREVRGALALFALAFASLVAAAIAGGFLCAAGFIYALQLGPIYACLIAFGVFCFATVILVAVYAAFSARRRRIERERAAADTPASPLADPRLLALGLQVARAVGVRRVVPIVAIAAVALALGSGARRSRAEARER